MFASTAFFKDDLDKCVDRWHQKYGPVITFSAGLYTIFTSKTWGVFSLQKILILHLLYTLKLSNFFELQTHQVPDSYF